MTRGAAVSCSDRLMYRLGEGRPRQAALLTVSHDLGQGIRRRRRAGAATVARGVVQEDDRPSAQVGGHLGADGAGADLLPIETPRGPVHDLEIQRSTRLVRGLGEL